MYYFILLYHFQFPAFHMCFSIFRGCHLVDLWLLEGFLVGEPRLGGGTGDPFWAPQRWIGYGAPRNS